MSASLLETIETYYDAAPRSIARAEHIGPFTLFVNPGRGFPYYARPTLGEHRFTVADVHRVCARQRELNVPRAFEWVAETTPELLTVIAAAGVETTRHPLMVVPSIRAEESAAVPGVDVRIATPEDDVALLRAVAEVAFTAPVGGLQAAKAAADRDPQSVAEQRERLRSGLTVMAAAFLDGQPVGVGSYLPVGGACEIVGMAVLPDFRRRGIAAALTRHLVTDALRRDVRTIFLSAGDANAARIYAHVGFNTIATACIAETSPPS